MSYQSKAMFFLPNISHIQTGKRQKALQLWIYFEYSINERGVKLNFKVVLHICCLKRHCPGRSARTRAELRTGTARLVLAFAVSSQPPLAQPSYRPTSPMCRWAIWDIQLWCYLDITFLQNTNYPTGYLPTAASTCTFTVNKINDNICQLRWAFSI